MKKDDLEKLAGLVEARKARDLARLEALVAEQRRLEAEIAELAATGARDAAEGPMPFAMLAQREQWAGAQIAHRQRRIAAIAIELAGVRAVARVSVGKSEALGSLRTAAERDARATRERAEETEGVAARPARAGLGEPGGG